MYSRSPGYRQNRNIYGRSSLPENYSGNAFREQENDGEFPESAPEPKEVESPADAAAPGAEMKPGGGTVASILSGAVADKFPFGHGVGSEEMLILGVMLAVMNSSAEENHNDMLLLLALLLFSG